MANYGIRAGVGGLMMVAVNVLVPADAVGQEFSRWSAFCEDGGRTAGVALGDIDGDSDLDVIFANGRHYAETDWAFLNDGTGTFYGARRLEGQADRSYGLALGELDGDGDLDVVVANDSGDRSAVYRNDGSGAFRQVASLGAERLGDGKRAVALADLDGDLDLDAVIVGDGQDHIYLNQGRGEAWDAVPFGEEISRGLSVVAADFDADGRTDLAVAYRVPDQVLVYRNEGVSEFRLTQRIADEQLGPTGLGVGDLDGDGDPDLVITNSVGPHRVMLNESGTRFAEAGVFGTGVEQAWSAVLGDVDLDGDLDVAVAVTNQRFWWDDLDGDGAPDRSGFLKGTTPSRFYLNDGQGRLLPGPEISTGSDAARPMALGDLDGDGDLDVVVGNDCQPNTVFFNSLRQ